MIVLSSRKDAIKSYQYFVKMLLKTMRSSTGFIYPCDVIVILMMVRPLGLLGMS